MEERLRSKQLYKAVLYSIKVIPMLLAMTQLLNTILSCMGTDLEALSYIGGISLLPLLFLYLVSYVFRFCACHRMFLHYVAVNNSLNVYDLYFGIPLETRQLLTFYTAMAGMFLFTILYLYVKTNSKTA